MVLQEDFTFVCYNWSRQSVQVFIWLGNPSRFVLKCFVDISETYMPTCLPNVAFRIISDIVRLSYSLVFIQVAVGRDIFFTSFK